MDGQGHEALWRGGAGPQHAGGRRGPGLPAAARRLGGGLQGPDKTSEGWTRDSLAAFLRFLDAKAVRVLTIWFGNALLTPKTAEVCPWVMPMLRNWALNQSLDGP